MTTGSRPFITLTGIATDQDIRKTAVALVREGFAVVPVSVGGKVPICSLTAAEQKKSPGHPCGVMEAITDDKVANKVFQRLGKGGARYNLGMVAGPSRIITIDADQEAEVQAYLFDWADAENNPDFLTCTPTVMTPGMQSTDGEWKHKGGGHFHYYVPDGVALSWDVLGSYKAPGGYDVKWGMSQALVPPSVRPEGPYVPTGDILPVPPFILANIQAAISAKLERKSEAKVKVAHDGIASWSVDTSWTDLLEPHGWTESGKLDRCGCPIWTKPGGGTTTYKSATAHEADCDVYDLEEGHGPLHIWTYEPPAPLDQFVKDGKTTITKLQYIVAVDYGGDMAAALKDLLPEPEDLLGWIEEPSTPTPESQQESVDVGETLKTPLSSTPTLPSEHEQPVDDEEPPITPPPVNKPPTNKFSVALKKAYQQVVAEYGLDMAGEQAEKKKRELYDALNAAMQRKAASEILRRAEASLTSDISTWLPAESFIEDFTSGAPEGSAPSILARSDGKYLLYRGRTNVITGRRGSGKTWFADVACMDTLQAGGKVLYVDMEDTRNEWRARFEAIGFDIDAMVRVERAVWVKPEGFPTADIDVLIEYMSEFDLVVFDVMNRLMVRLGGDPNVANSQVIWLYDQLFDPVAGRGTCVLVLDHPNRRGQRADATLDDMAPGGGATKMNNASGHVIALEVVHAFSKDRAGGEVNLITLKDRCGHYEEGASAGRMVGEIDVADTIFMKMKIDLPTVEAQVDQDELDLKAARDRILTLLDKHGAASKRTLQQGMTASMRPKFSWALEGLANENLIEQDSDGQYVLPDPKA